MGPKPFTVQVPAGVLDDLRSRLACTRWPDPLPCPGWAAGADIGYLKELVACWEGSFDWGAQERRLYSFAQFTAGIGGQRVTLCTSAAKAPTRSRWCLPTAGRAGSPSCSSWRRC